MSCLLKNPPPPCKWHTARELGYKGHESVFCSTAKSPVQKNMMSRHGKHSLNDSFLICKQAMLQYSRHPKENPSGYDKLQFIKESEKFLDMIIQNNGIIHQ